MASFALNVLRPLSFVLAAMVFLVALRRVSSRLTSM